MLQVLLWKGKTENSNISHIHLKKGSAWIFRVMGTQPSAQMPLLFVVKGSFAFRSWWNWRIKKCSWWCDGPLQCFFMPFFSIQPAASLVVTSRPYLYLIETFLVFVWILLNTCFHFFVGFVWKIQGLKSAEIGNMKEISGGEKTKMDEYILRIIDSKDL